jgi:Vacuolar protein sorting-associated protein 62
VAKSACVWTSQGSQAQGQVSVWSPTLDVSTLHHNKTIMCMGHFVVKGFAYPKSNKHMVIELTDNNTTRLKHSKVSASVLATTFPFPLRFKVVWTLKSAKPVYAWRAVPPEGFLALGMVCTNTEDPPPVECIRCVPEAWCVPSKFTPQKVWDDSGAGGGKPGSVWVVNSLELVAFTAGHDAPKETFYDLKSNRFFINQFARVESGEVTFI